MENNLAETEKKIQYIHNRNGTAIIKNHKVKT